MISTPQHSSSAPQDESSAAAARKLYRDFANGDIEAVLSSFDPHIEWREAEGNPYQPDGTPFRGPQEVLERLFVSLAQDWDGFAVAPEAFHGSEDGVVVVEARYTGSFKPTGRPIDAEVCHVLTYREGKLTKFGSTSTRLSYGR